MSLAIGTRLGPYEIHSALGAGGMGEVYRALDTRLARTVAIKVLPEHVRSDPGLQQRFEREARAISSLNHPNICTLYDVGHSDAGGQVVDYLVLEYLEGETLASRLVRLGAEATPLPVADALTVATQIASALDQAHRAGIVHRDLKPGNIFLVGRIASHETRRGGRQGSAASAPLAKLLDFGLAKSASPVVGGTSVSMLPTTPAVDGTKAMPPLTAQGSILGTFQYMAPEQVEGLESDARTDIFAFGAVLFEMMTGRLAFEGKSRASLLGAILKDEPPPISSLNAAAPPELDRIVSTCLAKDPDDRWQTARDLLRELRWVSESPRVTATSASPEPSSEERQGRRRTGWVPWAATAALATALGVVLAVGVPWRTPPPTVMRFAIVPPAAQPLLTSSQDRQIVISPDGARIVYVSALGRQLMVRELGRLEAQPLRGATNARHPFFSPDGRWVGFFQGTEIKKVPVLGGPPQTIARNSSTPRGASWGSNDTIVFANSDGTTGLMSVPAAGGEPKVLSRPERGELDHVFPSVLPGGRAVLFTILPEGSIDRAQVAVLDLETGTKKVLLRGGSYAEYTEMGHLLYASAGTLRAVQFDPTRLEVRGDPVLLAESVAMAPTGAAGFTVSGNSTLAYMPGGAGGADVERSIVWVSRQGREDAIKGAPLRGYFTLRLSPDGARVALDIRDQENDIWVW
ncbi:MAG TPA: protein kinase, partial [Vicinamibacterales bacterium]|nr:protein kinase [Vicinamibacterales bacterium]